MYTYTENYSLQNTAKVFFNPNPQNTIPKIPRGAPLQLKISPLPKCKTAVAVLYNGMYVGFIPFREGKHIYECIQNGCEVSANLKTAFVRNSYLAVDPTTNEVRRFPLYGVNISVVVHSQNKIPWFSRCSRIGVVAILSAIIFWLTMFSLAACVALTDDDYTTTTTRATTTTITTTTTETTTETTTVTTTETTTEVISKTETTTEKPTAKENITEKKTYDYGVDDGNYDYVYIGKTGTKYHRKDCMSLKGKGTRITLKEAQAQGRGPCGICY
jgi:hypothetical protein